MKLERLVVLEQFHNLHSYETFQSRMVTALLLREWASGIFVYYEEGMTMEDALIEIEAERRLQRAASANSDPIDEAFLNGCGEEACSGYADQKDALDRNAAGSVSMRSVYRTLVRWLHPDREFDDQLRELKTAMVQKANLAYAQGDMGTLLLLRIEALQIPGLAEAVDIKAEYLDDIIGQIETQIRVGKKALTHSKRDLRAWAKDRLPFIDRLTDKGFKAAMNNLQRDSRTNLEEMRRFRDDTASAESMVELEAILYFAQHQLFSEAESF